MVALTLEKLAECAKNDLIAIAARFDIPMMKQEKKEGIKWRVYLVEQKILSPAESIAQRGTAASDADVGKMELQLEMCHLELKEKELQHQFELPKIRIGGNSVRVSAGFNSSVVAADFDVNKCI